MSPEATDSTEPKTEVLTAPKLAAGLHAVCLQAFDCGAWEPAVDRQSGYIFERITLKPDPRLLVDVNRKVCVTRPNPEDEEFVAVLRRPGSALLVGATTHFMLGVTRKKLTVHALDARRGQPAAKSLGLQRPLRAMLTQQLTALQDVVSDRANRAAKDALYAEKIARYRKGHGGLATGY